MDVDWDVSTERNMEEVIVEVPTYHKRWDVTHINVPANGPHGNITNVADYVDGDGDVGSRVVEVPTYHKRSDVEYVDVQVQVQIDILCRNNIPKNTFYFTLVVY